jgi:hypothetical protein
MKSIGLALTCFWLSPAITIRSPGSMVASSNSVARSGEQIFEPGPQINAALTNRSPQSAARWFDLAFIINAFGFAV